MIHREVLNKHKVEILKRMADHVIATGRNEVPLSILKDNINDYSNAQKLRLHALIFKVKRGTWGITSHGWEFLRGARDLPKRLYVENNEIQSRSDELVNVRDLVHATYYVAQTFEYYDGAKRVGPRPMVRPSNQMGLL